MYNDLVSPRYLQSLPAVLLVALGLWAPTPAVAQSKGVSEELQARLVRFPAPDQFRFLDVRKATGSGDGPIEVSVAIDDPSIAVFLSTLGTDVDVSPDGSIATVRSDGVAGDSLVYVKSLRCGRTEFSISRIGEPPPPSRGAITVGTFRVVGQGSNKPIEAIFLEPGRAEVFSLDLFVEQPAFGEGPFRQFFRVRSLDPSVATAAVEEVPNFLDDLTDLSVTGVGPGMTEIEIEDWTEETVTIIGFGTPDRTETVRTLHSKKRIKVMVDDLPAVTQIPDNATIDFFGHVQTVGPADPPPELTLSDCFRGQMKENDVGFQNDFPNLLFFTPPQNGVQRAFVRPIDGKRLEAQVLFPTGVFHLVLEMINRFTGFTTMTIDDDANGTVVEYQGSASYVQTEEEQVVYTTLISEGESLPDEGGDAGFLFVNPSNTELQVQLTDGNTPEDHFWMNATTQGCDTESGDKVGAVDRSKGNERPQQLLVRGSGRVILFADPNPDAEPRSVTVDVEGHTLTFTQDGADSKRPDIVPIGIVEAADFTPGIVSGGWASIFGEMGIRLTQVAPRCSMPADGRLSSEPDRVRGPF